MSGIFIALAIGTLAIAAGFALWGLWLALPFAVLELSALAAALSQVRQSRREQTLLWRDEQLEIQTRRGDRATAALFNTRWLRWALRSGHHPGHPRRLVVYDRGRELEIGAFLAEEERDKLVQALSERLHRGPLTERMT